jgi:predicted pyridoxine 5'-phosphate oxidase superfamily flavin-nucleotide-binding protein
VSSFQAEEVERVTGSAGERELQERYGTTRRAGVFYGRQMLDHLNEEMQDFIAHMEMVFVATADADGEADCTFRAGPPGFVHVLDRSALAYPEYRGNGVMATLGNLHENAHVGLLFVDFFRTTVGLHVNGAARVVENEQFCSTVGRDVIDLRSGDHPVRPGEGGPRPERWVIVDVEEAYIHCSKHVPLLVKLDKSIVWGSDDTTRKGGDFFNVAGCLR